LECDVCVLVVALASCDLSVSLQFALTISLLVGRLRTGVVASLSDEWDAWERYCSSVFAAAEKGSVPDLTWAPICATASPLPADFPRRARPVV
jgi:hypothetical protein